MSWSGFGPPGQFYGGQTAGLPWAAEVHQLYKWDVGEAWDGCELPTNLPEANCVVRWRVHHHPGGAASPNNHRFHSYWIEAEICTQDGHDCGILRTGGMGDYGCLFGDYKMDSTLYIPLPNDPEVHECSQNNIDAARAYRAMVRSDSANFAKHLAAGSMPIGWVGDDIHGWNQIADLAYHANDGWGPIDPADPTRLILVCPQADCQLNHSNAALYQVNLHVPEALDQDSDGVVSLVGWTNGKGEILPDGSCQTVGVDCIPLVLENVPIGLASWSSRFRPKPFAHYAPEYDISPPGEHWIKYPN